MLICTKPCTELYPSDNNVGVENVLISSWATSMHIYCHLNSSVYMLTKYRCPQRYLLEPVQYLATLQRAGRTPAVSQSIVSTLFQSSNFFMKLELETRTGLWHCKLICGCVSCIQVTATWLKRKRSLKSTALVGARLAFKTLLWNFFLLLFAALVTCMLFIA